MTDEPEDEEKNPHLQTERDQKFVELFAAENFNLAKREECAVKAGFQPGYGAMMNGRRISAALINNKKMQKALKKKGIDFNKIADKLVELLDCKHPAFPKSPDNAIQHKAVETCIRISDAFPPNRVELDKREQKEIILTGEVVHRLEKFEKFKALDVLPEPPERPAD
jgi:hypothetical protein